MKNPSSAYVSWLCQRLEFRDYTSAITFHNKIFLSCGQGSVPILVEEAQNNSQVLLGQWVHLEMPPYHGCPHLKQSVAFWAIIDEKRTHLQKVREGEREPVVKFNFILHSSLLIVLNIDETSRWFYDNTHHECLKWYYEHSMCNYPAICQSWRSFTTFLSNGAAYSKDLIFSFLWR